MDNKKEKKIISKKTKRNLLLVINIVIMISLIVIATYSWFSRNLVDTINPDTVSLESSTNLEMRFSNEDEWAYVATFDFANNAVQREITGDGLPAHFSYATTHEDQNQVYVPNTTDTSGWKTSTSTGSDQIKRNSDYVIQTIQFRSTKKLGVYLGKDSSVLAAAETNGNNLIASEREDVGNVSTYGPDSNDMYYSKDCVVGASRISFISEDENTRLLTWLPRADICYEQTATNGVVTDVINVSPITLKPITSSHNNPFNTGSTPENHIFYTLNNGAAQKTVWTKNSNHFIAGQVATDESDNDTNDKIIDTVAGDDGFYYATVKFVCWIEGCDQEARRAFTGGRFGVGIQFIGVEE